MLLFSFSSSRVIKPNQVIVNIFLRVEPVNKGVARQQLTARISRAEKLDIYKINPCDIMVGSAKSQSAWGWA